MDEIIEELVAYADSHDVSNGLYAYQFDAFANCNIAEGIIPTKEMLDEKFKDMRSKVSENRLNHTNERPR